MLDDVYSLTRRARRERWNEHWGRAVEIALCVRASMHDGELTDMYICGSVDVMERGI